MNPDDTRTPDGNEGAPHTSQEKGEAHSSSQQESQGHHTPTTFVHSLAFTSKWLFLLAVIGTGIISVALFLYGFLLSLYGVYHIVLNFSVDIHVVKEYLATAVQIIDIFLVATVFYLISMGLYELFIAKAPLPGWVEIRTLDDLKTKLLGLTVIALAVIFLGAALTLSTGTGILELGAAIGIMIAAIAAYLWVKI
ncbi:MAG: YqhA family protein [Methanomicrobiales archaeon]|nr:YqhA family protein [Methanomicrobiales archaeon]